MKMENFTKVRMVAAHIGAVAATVCAVVGYKMEDSETSNYMMGAALLLTLVSYVMGGLFEALKMGLDIALSGFRIGFFPANFVAFAATCVLALFVVAYLPIIPVRRAYNKKVERGLI